MADTTPYGDSPLRFAVARGDFQRVHRRARLQAFVARLRRRPVTLRSFADLRRPMMRGARRLTEVCLDRVRGSVGRAGDYTDGFLPRSRHDEDRWARVRLSIDGDLGVPPVELIEVDGTYYVQDGHHRVSAFRALGVRRVSAYVTEMTPLEV